MKTRSFPFFPGYRSLARVSSTGPPSCGVAVGLELGVVGGPVLLEPHAAWSNAIDLEQGHVRVALVEHGDAADVRWTAADYLMTAADYLMEEVGRDRPTIRLFHQALADALLRDTGDRCATRPNTAFTPVART